MLLLLHNPPVIPWIARQDYGEIERLLRQMDDDLLILLLWWMITKGD